MEFSGGGRQINSRPSFFHIWPCLQDLSPEGSLKVSIENVSRYDLLNNTHAGICKYRLCLCSMMIWNLPSFLPGHLIPMNTTISRTVIYAQESLALRKVASPALRPCPCFCSHRDSKLGRVAKEE